MNNPILTEAEREARVVALLERAGLPPQTARVAAERRWPMSHVEALAECQARGLGLKEPDLTEFLHARFKTAVFPDTGLPVTADAVGWNRQLVNELLAWAGALNRGFAPDPAKWVSGPITLAALVEGLRSPISLTRMMSAVMLTRAFAAGLVISGEHEEDVAAFVAPEFLALVERAVDGDTGAVDELAKVVTNDPAAAFDPAADRPVRVEVN